MVKTAKIFLWFLIAVVCLWQLPYIWNFLSAKQQTTPFVLYSSVAGDFTIRRSVDNNSSWALVTGEKLTRHEYDSLLPEYFAKQLASENRLPDTILSKPVSLKFLTDENISFRIKPEALFGPSIPLYQMLEGASGRVDLEMPPDVFRITDSKMEFINKDDNKVNEDKSTLFTEALKNADFAFPAAEVAGNPTVKKKYDNGFLIVDSKERLFNLKMVKGNPVLKRISVPLGITPKHCLVTEFNGKHRLGLFFDTKNCLYVIALPDNRVLKVEIPPVDLLEEEMTVMGNAFTWTIRIKNDEKITWYAVDSQDFKLLKTYTETSGESYLKGLSFEKNGWIDLGWR